MTYVYEVRKTKIRKERVILVPYEDLPNYQGFRSMYGYPANIAQHILAEGNTAGLSGVEVYSDLLLVDFDDKPELGHQMAEELRAYDWVKFDSGGRSIHLHVRINPMLGADVPYMQKEWMRKHFPGADLSIYKTAGIYRLAGTYHESNPGHCKEVIETNFTGKSLEIEQIERPIPLASRDYIPNEDLEGMLMHLMGRSVHQGTTGRNYHAFKISKVCKHLGLDPREAADFVGRWNRNCCVPPLPASGLEATIRSAYREVTLGQQMGYRQNNPTDSEAD